MSAQLPQDQYIKVGQINTRYWVLGEAGSTVLLLHGIGASIEFWMYNVAALAGHHRVYALDIVGFGRSDKPSASYSAPYLARFVKDFMVAQDIDRASLIGNSMGAGVALEVARLFPEGVDKLVLAPSPRLGKEISIILRLVSVRILGELLTRPSRRLAAQSLKTIVHDPTVITDELIQIFYEMSALPGAQRSFLATLRYAVNFSGQRAQSTGPILESPPTITARTLIVWGQRDPVLPVAHAYNAERGLPNARLHVFDHCGHMPPIERAEEFNALVLDFLSSRKKD